ncbi:hypothetical protein BRD20_05770 [Halobacteriales archaeon SW_8_65_20]|nr:MAG: hypothetical protein BRC71_03920 [Halobacteriales archaeon QH_7_65_31]PSQ32142.1 MAG: hypothetical protein BRD16_01275 [Halobacteriales archaeon SW_6_65_46]PSQ52767.1 MAG: hypothetical protein BRD20_05770 [Halobacteriales archaeon SW_8_65_20]
MTADDEQLRVKIVQKLARKKVVGSHKKQVDTVKNWVATSEQGRAEELLREMMTDPEAPLERYGGSRDNVRLSSIEAAKQYIRDHGGELPWGLK